MLLYSRPGSHHAPASSDRGGVSIAADSPFEDRSLVCDGLRLHYLDWGGPWRRPLLLLHGVHGHAHAWDTFAAAACDGHRVLALDLRGHGDSQWAHDGAYAVEDYLNDLSAFVRECGLDAVSLVGLSLGGIVSLAFAAMNPLAVERLVIVDIGPDIAVGGLEQIRQAARARPADFVDLDEALRWALDNEPLADRAELRRTLQFNLTATSDGRLGWRYDPAADSLLGPAREGGASVLWELWSAIVCPTLVVRGEHSDLLTSDTARQMVGRAQRATLAEVPDAGHVVMRDNPSAFRDAVKAFLS